MSWIKEFKEFAVRGNMVDLATGVIIGTAFGKIVTSLVNDVIMPVISLLTGKIDFTNMFVSFDGKHYNTLQEAQAAGASTLNYGQFITNVVDFIIVAFCVFLIIKWINRLMPKPKEPDTTKECPYCFSKVDFKAVRCPYCTSDLK